MIKYIDPLVGIPGANYSLIGNGTNKYLSNTALSTSLSGNFTISIWARWNSIGADSYILNFRQSGGTEGYRLFFKNADKHTVLLDEAGTERINNATNYTANGFLRNVVLRRTGNVYEVFIDNTSLGTYTAGSALTFTQIAIGGRFTATNCFKGYISEPALWNRALTNAEIADLFNSGLGIYWHGSDTFPSTATSLGTNIIGAWHLLEGTGNVSTADATGNGNTLTMNNYATLTTDWNTSAGYHIYSGRTWNTAKRIVTDFNTGDTGPDDVIHMPETPAEVTTNIDGQWSNENVTTPRTCETISNTSPINIKITGHNFVNDDIVYIYNSIACGGCYRITKVDNDNFTLNGSVANGAGTNQGVCSKINSRAVRITSGNSLLLSRGVPNWLPGTGVTITAYSAGMYGNTFYFDTSSAVTTARKLIYYTLPATTDCSGYQSFILALMTTLVVTSAGALQIKLCTDTTGDTPATSGTVNIPAMDTLSKAFNFSIDNGSACSSGIKSVAIYSTVSFASQRVYFFGLSLTKAPTSTDYIGNHTLIRSPNRKWYMAGGFFDDFIVLRSDGLFTRMYNLNANYYDEPSETTKIHTIQPADISNNGVNYMLGFSNTAGTEGHPITIEGGYNKTTDTKTGVTWFTSMGLKNYGFRLVNDYIKLKDVNFTGFASSAVYHTLGTGNEVENITCVANGYGFNLTACTNFKLKNVKSYANGYGIYGSGLYGCDFDSAGTIDVHSNFGGFIVDTVFATKIGHIYADYSSGSNEQAITFSVCSAISIGNISSKYGQNYGLYLTTCFNFNIGDVDTSYANRVSGQGAGNLMYLRYNRDIIFNSLTCLSLKDTFQTYPYSADNVALYAINNVLIKGGMIDDGRYACFNTNASNLRLRNVTLDATTVSRWANVTTNDLSTIYSEKENGTAGNNKIYFNGGLCQADTTSGNIHSTGAFSYKFSPTALTINEDFPLEINLGYFKVTGGISNTIFAWVKRDDTGVFGKLWLDKNYLSGMTNIVSDTISVGASTWEKLELTFTPSEDGIVPVTFRAWGGSTYNIWLDDINGVPLSNNIFRAEPVYIPVNQAREVINTF